MALWLETSETASSQAESWQCSFPECTDLGITVCHDKKKEPTVLSYYTVLRKMADPVSLAEKILSLFWFWLVMHVHHSAKFHCALSWNARTLVNIPLTYHISSNKTTMVMVATIIWVEMCFLQSRTLCFKHVIAFPEYSFVSKYMDLLSMFPWIITGSSSNIDKSGVSDYLRLRYCLLDFVVT